MNLGIALVSGGLDSCVTAALATPEVELAFLHLNYRQRTEKRELVAFTALADHYQIEKRLVVDEKNSQHLSPVIDLWGYLEI